MSDTTFFDKVTTVVSSWLNDVNRLVYDIGKTTGSSLVGHIASASGAVAGTVQSKLRNIVQVNDFVTAGAGTSASPWLGWDTSIIWATATQYNFIDGYYAYTTSPNFAKDFLCLNGSKGTVIRHTGTGYAMVFDAGSALQLNIGIDIGGGSGFVLESTAAATGGVYTRGVIHSKGYVRFHNVPGICFLEITGVLNEFRLETTALVVGQSVIPVTLYSDNRRGVGQETSAGRYKFIAENCSSYGVTLNYILNSTFHGGTSEANAGGYNIDSGCKYNTFLNCDLESNSAPDITCVGSYNNFIGILSTGTATINGLGNIVQGGAYNTINSGGTNNVFGPLSYSNNGGAFTDTGANTTARSLYSASALVMRQDNAPNPVASFKSGNGTIAGVLNNTATTLFAANAVGRYDVIVYITSGDAVSFTASATVLSEDGGTSRIIANNGALLVLTLVAGAVKVTQTSGATQSVKYIYSKIF